MKLLVQADDYGITPAVADGIIYGIVHGVIRNTGIIINMPWAEECVEKIRPYFGHIAFGIDLNLTTGYPVTMQECIPSLVKEDGSFYSSRESRALDALESDCEHIAHEEVRKEFKAQIQKFEKIVGKKPDYIHGHAYITERIIEIQQEIACDMGIPFTSDVWKKISGNDLLKYRIPWYKKPPTIDNQADSSLKSYILDNSKDLLRNQYVVLAGHMGYVDSELLNVSSYHLLRAKDLEGVTSSEILDWVEKNEVELIDYREWHKR